MPTDELAETFVNTMAAWINMLVLSSAEPFRAQISACATSLENIDLRYDPIANGRVRGVLVSGTSTFEKDRVVELANMH